MRGFDPAFYFSEPAALAFDKVAQEHGQLNAFANAVNIFSSHDLPSWEFWEDLELGFSAKSLNLLVGAAGFEPTTCSTQNCRATRLRYTPIIWETSSIHA